MVDIIGSGFLGFLGSGEAGNRGIWRNLGGGRMNKLNRWWVQCLMGCVVGLFVTTGVYFFETRPRAKASPVYFSITNHNAELMWRAHNIIRAEHFQPVGALYFKRVPD